MTKAAEYRELVIGSGKRIEKILYPGNAKEFASPVTLDINPDHRPDVIWDLECLPLPFQDDTFNEIHAYEALEHTGTQGDHEFFFAQFSDFWRILKSDGLLFGSSPALNSPWVWGDPGHSRVITPQSFVFLDQMQYEKQIGKTAMSDYRYIYSADFELILSQERDLTSFYALKAVKPSRVKVLAENT